MSKSPEIEKWWAEEHHKKRKRERLKSCSAAISWLVFLIMVKSLDFVLPNTIFPLMNFGERRVCSKVHCNSLFSAHHLLVLSNLRQHKEGDLLPLPQCSTLKTSVNNTEFLFPGSFHSQKKWEKQIATLEQSITNIYSGGSINKGC